MQMYVLYEDFFLLFLKKWEYMHILLNIMRFLWLSYGQDIHLTQMYLLSLYLINVRQNVI